MWLYVDILKPATKKQFSKQPVTESQSKMADSLMKVRASLPKDLLIYFEFDDSKFKSDPLMDNNIAEFKKCLNDQPEYKLYITGHTDFIGPPEYNLKLGLERAQSVRNYLEAKGIPVNKMVTGTKGKEEPVADNITRLGRAKNRRTEISIKN